MRSKSGMEVKIKKLNPNAVMPKKAHSDDAGFDLTAISVNYNAEYGYFEYGTGLAFEIPKGHVGLLFPRSSISNKDLTLTNSVGVSDSTYRGEIRARFKLSENGMKMYSSGDRIIQMIIMPYPEVYFTEVEDLDSTDRGTGGFGSTNKGE